MSEPSWRHDWTALDLLRVPITDAQRRLVTDGGEALVLRGLPDPQAICVGCGENHEDQAFADSSGMPVFVVGLLRCRPWDSTYSEHWKSGRITLAESFDAESQYEPKKGWRLWPSVVGQWDDDYDAYEPRWQDEDLLEVRRIWSTLPLESVSPSTALALLNAGRSMVTDSLYDEYLELMQTEAELSEMGWIDMEEDATFVDRYTDLVTTLSKHGLIEQVAPMTQEERDGRATFGYRPEPDIACWRPTDLPLTLAPLETYLPSQTVKDTFITLKALSKVSALRARRAYPKSEWRAYARTERLYDPWF